MYICYMYVFKPLYVGVPPDNSSVFFAAPLIANVPASQVHFHQHEGVFAWLNLTGSILNTSKVHQCVDINLISPLASWAAFFPLIWTLTVTFTTEKAACSAVLIIRISAQILSNFHTVAFALNCFRVTEQTDYEATRWVAGRKQGGKISLTKWKTENKSSGNSSYLIYLKLSLLSIND